MPWAIARRTFIALVTLLLATIVVFGAVHALPGGPATALSADSTNPAALAATIHRYGFDQPLPVQYARWIGEVLRGQLGASPVTDIPVATQLAQRLPITLELAVLALAFAVALGVPAGSPRPSGRGTSTTGSRARRRSAGSPCRTSGSASWPSSSSRCTCTCCRPVASCR